MLSDKKWSAEEILEMLEEILEARTQETSKQKQSIGLLDEYGPILSVQDVEKITGLCDKTIRSHLSKGEIPGRSIGRRWLIPRDTLNDYLHGKQI